MSAQKQIIKPKLQTKKNRITKNRKKMIFTETTVKHAYLKFTIHQEEKGNSKHTIDFYNGFYKKFVSFLNSIGYYDDTCPIGVLTKDGFQLLFIKSFSRL